MDNSFLASQFVGLQASTPEVNLEQLREREGMLAKLISAIQEIYQTNGWSTLKQEVLDGLNGSLEWEMLNEAKKDSPDPLKLNRIAGEMKYLERYDLLKLEQTYKTELSNIKLRLYGKTQKD